MRRAQRVQKYFSFFQPGSDKAKGGGIIRSGRCGLSCLSIDDTEGFIMPRRDRIGGYLGT